MTTLKVEGMVELDRALLQFEKATTQRKVLAGALREVAKPVARSAKRNVPYDYTERDTYHLRDHIRIRAFKVSRQERREGTVAVAIGPVRREATEYDKTTYPIVGGLSKHPNSPNYARIVEAETGFLLSAFELNKQGIIDGFADAMRKHIDRQARIIAARNAIRR